MPVYPASLPELTVIRSLSLQEESSVVRTVTEAGQDHVRRRFSGTTTRFQFATVLLQDGTTNQLTILRDFFRQDLAAGSLSFDMDDPVFGTAEKWRFTDPFTFAHASGNLYNVQISLERLP